MNVTILNDWNRKVLQPEDTVEDAKALFKRYNCSELPVIQNMQCLGILEQEQLQALDDQTPINLGVLKPYVSINQKENPAALWLKLIEKQCSTLILVDEKNKFTGFVNTEDIIRIYKQLLGIGETDCVLVLKMRKLDYSLAKLAHLAEEAECQILNAFTINATDSEQVFVNLDVHCDRPESFIQSLERHDYEVAKLWCKTEEDDVLQERLDMLMNYLNV